MFSEKLRNRDQNKNFESRLSKEALQYKNFENRRDENSHSWASIFIMYCVNGGWWGGNIYGRKQYNHAQNKTYIKGIFQPFKLGGVTSLIQSAVKFCKAGGH